MPKEGKNDRRRSSISFLSPQKRGGTSTGSHASKRRNSSLGTGGNGGGGHSDRRKREASSGASGSLGKGKRQNASKQETLHGKREQQHRSDVLSFEDTEEKHGSPSHSANSEEIERDSKDSLSFGDTEDDGSQEETESSNVLPSEPLNMLYYTFFQLCQSYKLHKGCGHLRAFFGTWTDKIGLDHVDLFPEMKVLDLSMAYIGVKHLMILGDMLRAEKIDKYHLPPSVSTFYRKSPDLPHHFFVSRVPELSLLRLPLMCLEFNIDERQRLRLRPEDWTLLPSTSIFSPSARRRQEADGITTLPASTKTSGNAAVRYFLTAVMGHPSLQEVDMSNNPIGPGLLPTICRFIKGTPSVEKFHVNRTGLLPEEVERITAVCELNRRRRMAVPASRWEETRAVWHAVQVDWLRKWSMSIWNKHQQEMTRREAEKEGKTGRGEGKDAAALTRLSGGTFFSASAMLSSVKDTETDPHAVVKSYLPTSLPPLFVSETPYITIVPPPQKVVKSIELFLHHLDELREAGAKGGDERRSAPSSRPGTQGGSGRSTKADPLRISSRDGVRTPYSLTTGVVSPRSEFGRSTSLHTVSSHTAQLGGDIEDTTVFPLPSRPATRAWRKSSISSASAAGPSITGTGVRKRTSLKEGDDSKQGAVSLSSPTSTFLKYEVRYSHLFNTPYLRYVKNSEWSSNSGGGVFSTASSHTSPISSPGLPPSAEGMTGAGGVGKRGGGGSPFGLHSSHASATSTSSSSVSSLTNAAIFPREMVELMKTAFVDPRIAELTFLQGRPPCRTLPTCKAFGGLKGVGTARWIDGTISTMSPTVARELKKDIAGSLLMRAVRRILFPPPPPPPAPPKVKAIQGRLGEENGAWRTTEEEAYLMVLEEQEKQWNLLLSKLVSLMKPCRYQVGDFIYREHETPYWLWFLPSESIVEEEGEGFSSLLTPAVGDGKSRTSARDHQTGAPHDTKETREKDPLSGKAGADQTNITTTSSTAQCQLSLNALKCVSGTPQGVRVIRHVSSEEYEQEEVVVALHTNVPSYPVRRRRRKKTVGGRASSFTDSERGEGKDSSVNMDDEEEEDSDDEEATRDGKSGGHGGEEGGTSGFSAMGSSLDSHTVHITRGQFFGDRELFGTTSLYMYQRQKRMQEEARDLRQRYRGVGSRRHSSPRKQEKGGPSSSLDPSSRSTSKSYMLSVGGNERHERRESEGRRTSASATGEGSSVVDLGMLRQQYKCREGDAVLVRRVVSKKGSTLSGSYSSNASPHYQTGSMSGGENKGKRRECGTPAAATNSSAPTAVPSSTASGSVHRADTERIPRTTTNGSGAGPLSIEREDPPALSTSSSSPASTGLPQAGNGLSSYSTENLGSMEKDNASASFFSPPPTAPPILPVSPASSSVLLWQLPLEVAFFYLFDPYHRFHQKAASILQNFPETQDMHPSLAPMVGYVLQPFGVTVTEVQKLYGKSRTLSRHEELMHETIIIDEGDFVLSVVSSITGKKSEKILQGSGEGLVITNLAAYEWDEAYRQAVASAQGDSRASLYAREANNGKEILGKAAALQQYREQKAFVQRQQQQQEAQQQDLNLQHLPQAYSLETTSSMTSVFMSSHFPHQGDYTEGSSSFTREEKEGGKRSRRARADPSSHLSSPRFSPDGISNRDQVEYRLVFGTQASHWRYYRISNDDWALLPGHVRVALSRNCLVLGHKRTKPRVSQSQLYTSCL